MVTKDEILAEIRRLAVENDGRPIGRDRFSRETGIRESEWSGRYWTRWSDAVAEAGLEPNQLNEAALSEDELMAHVADLTVDLGHFPTVAERKMRRRTDASFPSHNTIAHRLGVRQDLLRRLVNFAATRPEYEAVVECCAPLLVDETAIEDKSHIGNAGFVYLIRMDKWHKLGCTTDILRRRGEIRLTLPVQEHLVHSIETDDPFGIERYWHQRFADRRARGEWFNLTPEDIRAFRRWKRIF
jgi:hypothetical protein